MKMENNTYLTLRKCPELKERAANWFYTKWGISIDTYLKCMNEYLNDETEYGWYLCLDGNEIVGGLGVIKNDFHEREDLTPNICAVYTEKDYRCRGIAGKLLDLAITDLRRKGITPVYLVTDHSSFYERYDWQFLCMVKCEGESNMSNYMFTIRLIMFIFVFLKNFIIR